MSYSENNKNMRTSPTQLPINKRGESQGSSLAQNPETGRLVDLIAITWRYGNISFFIWEEERQNDDHKKIQEP